MWADRPQSGRISWCLGPNNRQVLPGIMSQRMLKRVCSSDWDGTRRAGHKSEYHRGVSDGGATRLSAGLRGVDEYRETLDEMARLRGLMSEIP